MLARDGYIRRVVAEQAENPMARKRHADRATSGWPSTACRRTDAARHARGDPRERDHRRRLHRPRRRRVPDAGRPPLRGPHRLHLVRAAPGTASPRPRAARARRTERELRILTAHLEASLLSRGGRPTDWASVISEHADAQVAPPRRRARQAASPPRRHGAARRARAHPRAAQEAGLGLAAPVPPAGRVRARPGARRGGAGGRRGRARGRARRAGAPAYSWSPGRTNTTSGTTHAGESAAGAHGLGDVVGLDHVLGRDLVLDEVGHRRVDERGTQRGRLDALGAQLAVHRRVSRRRRAWWRSRPTASPRPSCRRSTRCSRRARSRARRPPPEHLGDSR